VEKEPQMFARPFRYATLALAALALATSINLTPVAEAANGPDLRIRVDTYALSSNGADGGSVWVYFHIHNDGSVKSAPTIVTKRCGYLRAPGNGMHLDWVAVDVMNPLVPAIDPSLMYNLKFLCPVSNGRRPVAYDIFVAPQGETNTADNRERAFIYQLD